MKELPDLSHIVGILLSLQNRFKNIPQKYCAIYIRVHCASGTIIIAKIQQRETRLPLHNFILVH